MNKTHINSMSICIALVVSALPTFAADKIPAGNGETPTIEERLAALESGAKKSSWAEKVKVKGDIRYRYEHKEKDNKIDKNRHRFRARAGAYGKVNDHVKAGIRIASGSDDSPTSTNQDVDGYGNKKEVWLDLAYLTYEADGFSATFGKMKQPWVQISDLMFDGDVNPEGISAAHTCGNDDITITSVLGYHIMEENKSDDVELLTGQISASAQLGEGVKLTAGVGGFWYDTEGYAVPTFGTKVAVNGNTETAPGSGIYMYDYEIVDGFAKLDIKKGPVPIKVFGEYLENMASDVDDDTAWLAGAGIKYKKLGLEYNYRDMDGDSVLGALTDGDFGGPGGKGHKVKAKYTILKNWTAGVTYYQVENAAGQDVDLAQAEFIVKF